MKIKTLVTALVAVGAAASLTGCTEGGGHSPCYAADGQAATSGNLYVVDKTTGAMTTVGAIGYSVTGLALNDGKLYGVTSTQYDDTTNSLISIDPRTGAGTPIGILTDGAQVQNIAEITFSEGVLYGWSETGDNLVAIDPDNGATTVIGSSLGTNGSGLADIGGVLHFVGTGDLLTLNKADGEMATNIGTPASPNGCNINGMSYDSETGMLYGLDTDCGGGSSQTDLMVINPATAAATSVASYGATNLDALACY